MKTKEEISNEIIIKLLKKGINKSGIIGMIFLFGKTLLKIKIKYDLSNSDLFDILQIVRDKLDELKTQYEEFPKIRV